MKRILIVFAHPAMEKSKIQKQLLASAATLQSLTIHDLYEQYPDFAINVHHEQELLRIHDTIVFQFPFYWYSSPSLLKEWLDLVLEYGFAYGHSGTALAGKQLLIATSTGGSQEVYQHEGHNKYTMREFLHPFEATASLCGMSYLPPFIIHGAHQLRTNEEAIQQQADRYREHLLLLQTS